MAHRNRNKVSAEFNMSSLTDIIFQLLIFFMLTANFVQIKPFELPEADAKTTAPTSIAVSITKDGKYSYRNQEMGLTALTAALKLAVREADNRENATITIAAEKGTSFNRVRDVMNIAKNLRVMAILATQPKE